jgi:hypothetical protein
MQGRGTSPARAICLAICAMFSDQSPDFCRRADCVAAGPAQEISAHEFFEDDGRHPPGYDWVESALWAGLVAFVIYFLINVVPNLPEMTRRAESMRALKIAAEKRSYCERWGMKQGTREHALCTIDLQELRTSIERNLSDEGVF